ERRRDAGSVPSESAIQRGHARHRKNASASRPSPFVRLSRGGGLQPKDHALVELRREVSREAHYEHACHRQIAGGKRAPDSGRVARVAYSRIVRAEFIEVLKCLLHLVM